MKERNAPQAPEPPIEGSDGGEKGLSAEMDDKLGLEPTFDSRYEIIQRLRSGSYATVFVTKNKLTKAEYAVKVINRSKLKPKDDVAVYREVKILKVLCGEDGIINLIEFFEIPKTFHVVLELARGGDVFDRLADRTVYNEWDARDLARKLLETIKFIHGKNIVHRDLKAENLLLMDEDDDAYIKIADFGFGTYYRNEDTPPDEKRLKTRCGTPAYVAPEVILGLPYDNMVDMWSCGVILFILLGGYPPFQGENHKSLFRKVRAVDYVFQPDHWDHISLGARQLIASLLVADPDSRMDAGKALKENTWLNIKNSSELSSRDLSNSLDNMKKFNARRKLKGAMHAITVCTGSKLWKPENIGFERKEVVLNPSVSAAMSKFGSGIVQKHLKAEQFSDIYDLQKEIQSGSFSTVWEGVRRNQLIATNSEEMEIVDSQPYAIKVVDRANLKPKDDAAVLNEVAILQSLRHPKYIVTLNDFFEEKDKFYIVMELMSGGDVFDRIVKRKQYSELDARNLARILLKAMDHIHSHKVAHRDLKPQNLLLFDDNDDCHIKVADFGFAKRVHTPNSLTTRCGTPTYVAPEIIKNHPYDERSDMWSVGVIIYVLLVGYPPFLEDDQKELFRNIRNGVYEFYDEDWESISPDAQELIRNMLVVDPAKRMSARGALRSKWIQEEDEDSLNSVDLRGSLSSLRKYQIRMKMKAAVHAISFVSRSRRSFFTPSKSEKKSNESGMTTSTEES